MAPFIENKTSNCTHILIAGASTCKLFLEKPEFRTLRLTAKNIYMENVKTEGVVCTALRILLNPLE